MEIEMAVARGFYTAVAGEVVLVRDGTNVLPRSGRPDANPRTAFGLSKDRRFVYLITIDGRQPGTSNGAYDHETAGWLLLLGAYDGINMDGGGSTTLVIENPTGVPIRLNRSSAVADSGRERTVGSHLGLFAKPLRGFMNDVIVVPDGTNAVLTWTTMSASIGEVEYGTSSDLGSQAGMQTDLATQHRVVLDGLSRATRYYFRVLASTGDQKFNSLIFGFSTENHAATNRSFELTHEWKSTTANPEGIGWIEPRHDDFTWEGPGPGLLWVNVRSTGPNPDVEPENTRLQASVAKNDFPFLAYSFSSDFSMGPIFPGSSLGFSDDIDDGAVVYVNGVEIHRSRMPRYSQSTTLATGFPCSRDTTCPDDFMLPIGSLPSLVARDNRLAVEAHDYILRSVGMAFGPTSSMIKPIERRTRIDIHRSPGGIQLSWTQAGVVLQSANLPQGAWSPVEGVAKSPPVLDTPSQTKFYRLGK